MNFIKVGESFINLDSVTEMRQRGGSVDVYFSGVAVRHEDGSATLEYNVTNYDGAEAEALVAWLDSIATDVVEQKRLREESERATQAFRKFYELAYAYGICRAPDVPTPSFAGTRRAAAASLGLTESAKAVFEAHCAQCAIPADADNYAAWAEEFVNGVLSA